MLEKLNVDPVDFNRMQASFCGTDLLYYIGYVSAFQ